MSQFRIKYGYAPEIALLVIIFLLIFLFVGTPDLHDAILNRVSNGQIPIPPHKP